MKKSLLTWLLYCAAVLIGAIWLVSCEQPSQDAINSPDVEQRGPKSNGNGHGNNGNNNPSVSYLDLPPTDWNIQADTSFCGIIKITWDAQPGFAPCTGCYPSARGYYFIKATPLSYTQSTSCAGSSITTNEWWHTYGYGCSIYGGNNIYKIDLKWLEWDSTTNTGLWHYAVPDTIVSGYYSIFNGC